MRQIYSLFSANETFSAIYAQITAINHRTAVFCLPIIYYLRKISFKHSHIHLNLDALRNLIFQNILSKSMQLALPLQRPLTKYISRYLHIKFNFKNYKVRPFAIFQHIFIVHLGRIPPAIYFLYIFQLGSLE